MPKKNYHQGFQYQLGGEYTPIKHTPLNQEGYFSFSKQGGLFGQPSSTVSKKNKFVSRIDGRLQVDDAYRAEYSKFHRKNRKKSRRVSKAQRHQQALWSEQSRPKAYSSQELQFRFSPGLFGKESMIGLTAPQKKTVTQLRTGAMKQVGEEPQKYIEPSYFDTTYTPRGKKAGTTADAMRTRHLIPKYGKGHRRSRNGKMVSVWRWNEGEISRQRAIHDSGKDASSAFYAAMEDKGQKILPPSQQQRRASLEQARESFFTKKAAFETDVDKAAKSLQSRVTKKDIRKTGELFGGVRHGVQRGRYEYGKAVSMIGEGEGSAAARFNLAFAAQGRGPTNGRSAREQQKYQHLAQFRMAQLGHGEYRQKVKKFRGRKEYISELRRYGEDKRPFSVMQLTKKERMAKGLSERTKKRKLTQAGFVVKKTRL